MKSLIVVTVLVFVGSGAAALAGAKGDAQTGKTVFTANCKTCHGPQGDGNPAIAKVLKVTIPILGSKDVQSKSDDQLKRIITEGEGKMKPVQGVSGKQVDDVIAFIRTLAKS